MQHTHTHTFRLVSFVLTPCVFDQLVSPVLASFRLTCLVYRIAHTQTKIRITIFFSIYIRWSVPSDFSYAMNSWMRARSRHMRCFKTTVKKNPKPRKLCLKWNSCTRETNTFEASIDTQLEFNTFDRSMRLHGRRRKRKRESELWFRCDKMCSNVWCVSKWVLLKGVKLTGSV